MYVTIRPRGTATPDAGAITRPEDVVTTASSMDVTTEPPYTEPPSETTSTTVAPGAEMVTTVSDLL